jgi:hypothetical protein
MRTFFTKKLLPIFMFYRPVCLRHELSLRPPSSVSIHDLSPGIAVEVLSAQVEIVRSLFSEEWS